MMPLSYENHMKVLYMIHMIHIWCPFHMIHICKSYVNHMICHIWFAYDALFLWFSYETKHMILIWYSYVNHMWLSCLWYHLLCLQCIVIVPKSGLIWVFFFISSTRGWSCLCTVACLTCIFIDVIQHSSWMYNRDFNNHKGCKSTFQLNVSLHYIISTMVTTAAVVQSVRASVPQAEGTVFESKPRQT